MISVRILIVGEVNSTQPLLFLATFEPGYNNQRRSVSFMYLRM